MTNKPLRDSPSADDASPAPAAIDYRMLAESTSDVIIRCGLNGIVSYVSPSVQQLLGLAPQELIGKSHRDLIVAEDMPAVKATVEGYRAGKTIGIVTYRMRRKDGRIIWVESNGRRIRNTVTGGIDLVLVQRDITERKALEAQLALLALTAPEGTSRSEPSAPRDLDTGKPRTGRRRTTRSVN